MMGTTKKHAILYLCILFLNKVKERVAFYMD